MFNLRQLVDFYVYGRHRLETVAMLPLGSTVDDATRLYGDALETDPSDECSAIPAIGVASVDFLSAQAEYKKANSLKQLQELDDLTWAPDDAILELQRQFVEAQSAGLMDFASRSDRIAASPDGRCVFIVRNHYACDVENGFRELNSPPEPDRGYSVQVLNFFTWDEDGSVWSKAVLPRDANVDSIGFEGEQCCLQIRQTTTNRVLTFCGPAASIRGLSGACFSHGAHDDNTLWKALEEEAEPSSGTSGPPPAVQP